MGNNPVVLIERRKIETHINKKPYRNPTTMEMVYDYPEKRKKWSFYLDSPWWKWNYVSYWRGSITADDQPVICQEWGGLIQFNNCKNLHTHQKDRI